MKSLNVKKKAKSTRGRKKKRQDDSDDENGNGNNHPIYLNEKEIDIEKITDEDLLNMRKLLPRK